MTISPQIRADIHRLYYAEHFTMNAIAHVLGIHHDTVKHALRTPKLSTSPCGKSGILAPYTTLIEESLKQYPKLRSTRLLQMIKDRGYKGGISILRVNVRRLRPKAIMAFMPLTMLPSEQAQVDWGHFGKLKVENTERKLSCFVLVLSYSRAMFACFTFDQALESFLRCHIKAFHYLGGIPRKLLYDNLKSVVISRIGQDIEFNKNHMEFAGHYHFKPEACNPRSGWEKGRVERSIRYIRDNFFACRIFKDIDDANQQMKRWLSEVANVRTWPDDRSQTVFNKWSEEKETLLALPEHDSATSVLHAIRSGKLPFVRFDLNDYSIPYQYVGKPLSLIADENKIEIFDNQTKLASHKRSYGKGKRIKSDDHFTGLLEMRGKAAAQNKQLAITTLIPEAADLIAKGEKLGLSRAHELRKLGSLIDEYSQKQVKEAICRAIACDKPRANFVSQILYENLAKSFENVRTSVELPDRQGIRQLSVKTPDLSIYDKFTTRNDNDNDNDNDNGINHDKT